MADLPPPNPQAEIPKTLTQVLNPPQQKVLVLDKQEVKKTSLKEFLLKQGLAKAGVAMPVGRVEPEILKGIESVKVLLPFEQENKLLEINVNGEKSYFYKEVPSKELSQSIDLIDVSAMRKSIKDLILAVPKAFSFSNLKALDKNIYMAVDENGFLRGFATFVETYDMVAKKPKLIIWANDIKANTTHIESINFDQKPNAEEKKAAFLAVAKRLYGGENSPTTIGAYYRRNDAATDDKELTTDLDETLLPHKFSKEETEEMKKIMEKYLKREQSKQKNDNHSLDRESIHESHRQKTKKYLEGLDKRVASDGRVLPPKPNFTQRGLDFVFNSKLNNFEIKLNRGGETLKVKLYNNQEKINLESLQNITALEIGKQRLTNDIKVLLDKLDTDKDSYRIDSVQPLFKVGLKRDEEGKAKPALIYQGLMTITQKDGKNTVHSVIHGEHNSHTTTASSVKEYVGLAGAVLKLSGLPVGDFKLGGLEMLPPLI